MLLILLLPLLAINSLEADVTAICEDVREVFHVINGQLLTYTPLEHCYDILSRNSESSNGCFTPIYDKICSFKLTEQVYGPTCQSTLSLFRRIIESGTVELGSNGEIVDYKNFCDKSFILVKGGAGGNVTDRPQRFQSEDVDNCRKIVESYNACVSLTSAVSNLDGKDCLYKFKFCELSASWNDSSGDSKYCREVIAPMMLMDALFVNGFKKNTCLDLSNYEEYLIKKKFEFDKNSNECLDTAESMTIVSKWEEEQLSSANEMFKTQETANEVFNKLHVYDSRGLGFDDAVLSEFDKVVQILEKGEAASMSFSHDFFRNVVIFSQIKESMPIIATHLASIEELLVRGHVSFTNAFGFHPITSERIEKVRAMMLQLFTKCRTYTDRHRFYSDPNDNIDKAMELRNKASEYKGISDQFKEQITVLNRWKQGESEKSLTLPSTLARLGNLAGA